MKFIAPFKNSEFNQRVTALSLSRFLISFSALLVLWVLARFVLDPIALSHYRKLWPFYGLFAPVLLSAILNTAYLNGSRHETARFALRQAFLWLFMGALLLASTAFVLAKPLASYFKVLHLLPAYQWFALYGFFALMGGFAEPLFVITKRTSRLPLYTLMVTSGDMLAILLTFSWTRDLNQVIYWMIVAQAVRLPVLLVLYQGWIRDLPDTQDRHPFEWKSIHYLISMALIALSGLGAVEINRFIVGRQLDDFAFILYDIGARKLPFITILTTSVSSAIVATYAYAIQQGRWDEVVQKIQTSTERLFRWLFPVLTVLAIGAPAFVSLVFGAQYRESSSVFSWFTVALLSNMLFPQAIVQASGRSWLIVWTAVVETLVNISLSLLLIKPLGISGVALATAISHWFYTILLLIYCRTQFKIPLRIFFPRLPAGWFLMAWVLLAGMSYLAAYQLHGFFGVHEALWILPVLLASIGVAIHANQAY